MHVAADGQIFRRQRYGGISRMFTSLEMHFQQDSSLGIDFRIISPLHYNSYLKDCFEPSSFRKRIGKIPNKARPAVNKGNQYISRGQVAAFAPEVLHETFYEDDFEDLAIPRVTTIFDMTREIVDGNLERLELKRKAILRADHVVCISENTKNDLMRFIDCKDSKISVIYLGIEKPEEVGAKSFSPSISSRPFILYVGDRSGYKNFEVLLSAFGNSKELRRDYQLIAFGGGKPSHDEILMLNSFNLSSKEVIFHEGDDALLYSMYEQASVFVYTSKYEGFGLPPLEAMLRNCPVVSSNSSCLPEVLGDAPMYFSPGSPEELTQVLLRVLTSEADRNNMVVEGLKQSNKYNWADAARAHSNVYRTLAKS
jgi:glycosyltransferase involved in cell wall biosynthesis